MIEQAQRLVKRYGMRLERDGPDCWQVEGGRGSPYTGLPDDDVGLFCRYMIGVLAREDELIEKSGHGT